MTKMPEQEIIIYKSPAEELYKVLVGNLEERILKVFSKVTAPGRVAYKFFAEDVKQNINVLAEGESSREEFENLARRFEEQMLKPLGKSWQQVSPKVIEVDPVKI